MNEKQKIISKFLEKFLREQQNTSFIKEFDNFFSKKGGLEKMLRNFQIPGEIKGGVILHKGTPLETEILFDIDNNPVIITPPHGVEQFIPLYPREAIEKNLNYEGKLSLKFKIVKNGEIIKRSEVFITNIPIPVGSIFCNTTICPENDQNPEINGGYFILRGIQRVLTHVETLAPSMIRIEQEGNKIQGKVTNYDVNNNVAMDRYFIDMADMDFRIYLGGNYKQEVPVAKIINYLSPEYNFSNFNPRNIEESALLERLMSQIKTIIYDGREMEKISQVFDKSFSINIRESDLKTARIKKIYTILENAKRILRERDSYEIDSLKNRSVLSPIHLISQLFQKTLITTMVSLKKNFEKQYSLRGEYSIHRVLKNTLISLPLNTMFNSGNWLGERLGVSQTVDITNEFSINSQTRRVISELDEKYSFIEARNLHPSEFGFYCPIETPDGKTVGLRKTLAIFTKISDDSTEAFNRILDRLEFFSPIEDINFRGTPIFLNSTIIGFTENLTEFEEEFLKNLHIHRDPMSTQISYFFEPEAIHFRTNRGRLLKLMGVFQKQIPLLTETALNGSETIDVMVFKNRLRWIDPIEAEKLSQKIYLKRFFSPDGSVPGYMQSPLYFGEKKGFIKELPKKEISYMHITPFGFLGNQAASLPALNHSSSTRGLFATSILKQAIPQLEEGINRYNGSRKNFLLYGQEPIASSVLFELFTKNSRIGVNTIMAITSAKNFNLEDAYVMNRAAVERGYMSYLNLEIYEYTPKEAVFGEKERIEVPITTLNRKNLETLDSKGIVKIGISIGEGQAIIGKTTPVTPNGESNFDINYRKSTTIYNTGIGEYTSVGVKIFKENGEERVIIKTISIEDSLEGDKFSTLQGQKGILGNLFDQTELPYTTEGIIPQVILNPQGITSRMNYAVLKEGFAGRKAISLFRKIDLTPFIGEEERDINIEDKTGVSPEDMTIFPDIGRYSENKIFIGINYFLKLKHLIKKKVFSRTTGATQALTGQPAEGRTVQGGLRMGEMERDCLLANGATQTILERFRESSDEITARYCPRCENIIQSDYNILYCKICGKEGAFQEIKTSNAFLLLAEELNALHIGLKYVVEKNKIKEIKISVLNQDLIKKKSVLEITKKETHNPDGTPVKNSILDPLLGPNDNQECFSCGRRKTECTGHSGHLEMAIPIYHPLYLKEILRILNLVCFNCHNSRGGGEEDENKRVSKICGHCGTMNKPVIFNKKFYEFIINNERIDPNIVYEIFQNVPRTQYPALGISLGNRLEDYLIKTLYIPSIKTRPTIYYQGGSKKEDDLTYKLSEIVVFNQKIREALINFYPSSIVQDLYYSLSFHVNNYIDNENLYFPESTYRVGKPIIGLHQRLKGKGGRFRMNLTGKRVNYTGRTVIIPDPTLRIDQIGVSKKMMDSLTVREEVNRSNFESIIKKIEEIPTERLEIKTVHVGNQKFLILEGNKEIIKNILMGYNDRKIYIDRKMKTGDIVLFNRQPSLHRMAMMAFEVVPRDGYTISMSPWICEIYNADFDGDEMNIHVLQSRNAIYEAKTLLSPYNNLFSPKSGTPNFGMIQDGVVGNYKFFKKEELTEEDRVALKRRLISISLEGVRDKTELLRRILELNSFNMEYSSNPNNKRFNIMNKEDVVFSNGELLRGVIDGNSLSPQKGRLLSLIFIKKSPVEIQRILFNLSNIATYELERQGFTITPDQIATQKEKEEFIEKRSQILSKKISTNEKLDELRKLGNNLIYEETKLSSFSEIIASGARGNYINLLQLRCFLGQQFISGRPIFDSFKSGKNISVDLTEIEKKGFISESYQMGQTPFSFFTQAIAALEGVIYKAIMVGKTGYIQRKFIHALENIHSEGNLLMSEYSKILSINFEKNGYEFYMNPLIEKLKDNLTKEDLKKLRRVSGKMMGIITAQSIGEPSSQIAMDIFHTAGTGVTSLASSGLKKLTTLMGVSKTGNAIHKLVFLKGYNSESVRRILAELFLEDSLYNLSEELNIDSENIILKMGKMPRYELIVPILGKDSFRIEGNKIIIPHDGSASDINRIRMKIEEGAPNKYFITGVDPVVKVDLYSKTRFNRLPEIEGIDYSQSHSGNIHEIYQDFGILGVEQYIKREFRDIFESEGIFLCKEHAEIISRIMCITGEPLPINREGINKGKDGFLSKASFENPLKVLVSAAIQNSSDHIFGATNMILGQNINLGTSTYELYLKNVVE